MAPTWCHGLCVVWTKNILVVFSRLRISTKGQGGDTETPRTFSRSFLCPQLYGKITELFFGTVDYRTLSALIKRIKNYF